MTAEANEQSEPTMEEILASIRKIIATEEPPAAAKPDEDVLELTEIVEDVEPELEPEVVVSAPVEEPSPAVAEPATEQPVEEPAMPEPEPAVEETPSIEQALDELVAPAAAAASATAFANLAEQLDDLRVTLPPNVEIGDGSQTLEQLVAKVMRPLLKEWLDNNLPATVERLVQKEIERIARQHRD